MLITFFSGSGIFPPFRGFRPAIGEARSTVFLDSCSTGQQPKNGGDPLAQLVADALPGVEVHAFEDVSYPKLVAWWMWETHGNHGYLQFSMFFSMWGSHYQIIVGVLNS